MERAEEYLQRAKEADAAAAKMVDAVMKRQWQAIADQWRALARQRGLFPNAGPKP